MPKQQLYAWASLGSSIAFAGLYIIFVIGTPFLTEPVRGGATEVFLWIVGISFLIELLLDLGSGRDRVDADERDRLIAGRAFKVGFHVFTVVLVMLIGHLFVFDFFNGIEDAQELADRQRSLAIHIAVLGFLAAHAAKSGTQTYLYGRGA
ncbi:MAG: hypothetical protein HKN17_04340 [Rhodothermales bacterium]|nr:hypothetical protein [Rhodothermales bacterium]